MKNRDKFDKKINALDNKRLKLYKKSTWVLPLTIIIATFLFFIAFMAVPDMVIFAAILCIILVIFSYYFLIGAPFDSLKDDVREFLLEEFMKIYHPTISYSYRTGPYQVAQLIQASKLVDCNEYEEEDVIYGKSNKIHFYLSEINLKQKSGKNTTNVFKGILFKLRIPGRQFPSAQIQSKPGLLNKVFGSFIENKVFGFWYDTSKHKKFEEELGPFFPFIRHLISKQKDIRISTKGNSITILMKSDMKFLDDPKPQLSRSFKDEKYYQKIGQQINSLLFIVEAFAGKLSKEEVVERLELKALEYEKLIIPYKSGNTET